MCDTIIIDGEEWEIVDENSPEEKGYEYRVIEKRIPYSYTLRALDMLIKAGVTTNIHYVLSKRTIDEAIMRQDPHGFPEGINAVIFLLHKPVDLVLKNDV